jgi:hypothetical protein
MSTCTRYDESYGLCPAMGQHSAWRSPLADIESVVHRSSEEGLCQLRYRRRYMVSNRASCGQQHQYLIRVNLMPMGLCYSDICP